MSKNQADWRPKDTDHFLWSCFLHRGDALFFEVLLNLLFIHGINWNAPPQFLKFCNLERRILRQNYNDQRARNKIISWLTKLTNSHLHLPQTGSVCHCRTGSFFCLVLSQR